MPTASPSAFAAPTVRVCWLSRRALRFSSASLAFLCAISTSWCFVPRWGMRSVTFAPRRSLR